MEKSVREILERPFAPEQIKQRQGNFGQTLDYIEGHEVIQRLNEAFDGDFSFEISWHDIRDDEVLVQGRLVANGIAKEQFGGSKVSKVRETGAIISIADDMKASATDCLKKCATLLGVGLHLYRNDQPSQSWKQPQQSGHRNNSQPPNKSNNSNGNGGNGKNGNGNSNGNGRATLNQMKAIFAIAQDKGISNKDARDLCVDRWGKTPDCPSQRNNQGAFSTVTGHK